MHVKKLPYFFYNNVIPYNVANSEVYIKVKNNEEYKIVKSPKRCLNWLPNFYEGFNYHPTMKLRLNI
ncbi:hypothetical protein Fmac_001538 [Flemingia macrophylla]|uniref:Uncharacterized protein n=1 Tax=Flemingia macrophylla TaxID=520843 RepID=A0ABD1NJ10_9FABA